MRKSIYEELYSAEETIKLLKDVITSTVPREKKIYTSRLTCWLIIGHFLLGIGSLTNAVLETFKTGSQELIGNCKRKRSGHWSQNTSALSQARKVVPLTYFQEMLRKLQEIIVDKKLFWHNRLVYGIDGTTISLQPTEKLRQRYRPSQNQYGQSAFPIVNVTVAHDLLTGHAEEPEWDPMYGDGRQSELEQTRKIFKRLKQGSVVVSDRAHGIFYMVNQAVRNELDVVYRLKEDRAKSLLKTKVLSGECDKQCEWRPSKTELQKYPELTSNSVNRGRIIVKDVIRDNKIIKVIIFTTLLDIPANEIVDLYGKRWQIEGDLRDLKKTLMLDELSARTPEVLDREILAAIVGYNIIRTLILFAAVTHGIEDPRRIGFKNAVTVLRCFTPELMKAKSQKECIAVVDQMLLRIAFVVNKKRDRSYPREIHKHRYQYKLKQIPIKYDTL